MNYEKEKVTKTGPKTAVMAIVALIGAAALPGAHAVAHSWSKPNILVIMGDDVGWLNVGAHHRGIMSGRTPNLDRLAW